MPNTYIVTKKQQIIDVVQDYESQVENRKAHAAGKFGMIPFRWHLELQTISPPFSPIDGLVQMLSERMTPDGRAMILLTPLVQSIQGFSDTVKQRNEWIAEVRALPEGTDAKKAAFFFGEPYAPGQIDVRYPNYIKGLKAQTDDCIAYSILIGESLVKYGERLAARYGSGAPKITVANFDKAKEDNLLPNMSDYDDWKN